jgi:serine/threonine protein kinase
VWLCGPIQVDRHTRPSRREGARPFARSLAGIGTMEDAGDGPPRKRSTAKDFVVLSRLGKGAFGTVYKCQRKQDGKVYALKKISIGAMPRREISDTMREVQ